MARFRWQNQLLLAITNSAHQSRRVTPQLIPLFFFIDFARSNLQFLVQQLQRKIPQELQHVFDWIIRLSSSWLVKSPEGFVKSYFTSELIESNLVSHKEPNANNRRNICTNFERNFYFLKIDNSKILICPYITIRSIYRSGKFRHAPRFIIFQKGLSELQEFFSTTWPFIIMNITLMLFCSFFCVSFPLRQITPLSN